jgi:hypothetical protein
VFCAIPVIPIEKVAIKNRFFIVLNKKGRAKALPC